jgi:hypothetical protein
MKLYYYPELVPYLPDIPLRLYTETAVAALPEIEQETLQELDDAAVQLIGYRPCCFVTSIDIEAREQRMKHLMRRLQEWFV